MNTKAAVLYKTNTPFEVDILDLELPRTREVLVRITAAGVCRSDWHLQAGATKHPLPVVAGHEGAGIVEMTGEGVENIQEGDRVILNWAPACGECYYCREGRPGLCEANIKPIWAGQMMDGSTRLSLAGRPVYHYSALSCFAERAVVPKEACVRIQKDIPAEVAALIGCAVTTGVGAVLNTAQVRPRSSVAVFGAGGVGLSIVMGALYAGAEEIIVVEPEEAKRKFARELGEVEVLPNDKKVVKNIRDRTGNRGADYVFDATGSPAVQEQCLESARPGGIIILAGLAPMGSSTNFPGSVITRQEKTIKGTYYGTSIPSRDFPRYADLYLSGRLPIEKLITKTFSLEQINQAFGEMQAGKLARGVIVFPV